MGLTSCNFLCVRHRCFSLPYQTDRRSVSDVESIRSLVFPALQLRITPQKLNLKNKTSVIARAVNEC